MMHIRRARPEDASLLADLQQETWLVNYRSLMPAVAAGYVPAWRAASEDQAREWQATIESGEVGAWIAFEDGQALAYCKATRNPREIAALYVLPQGHGQGIGGRLITRIFEWLGDNGAIYVSPAMINTGAISFYQHYGFSTTGCTSHLELVPGQGITLVEMRRPAQG